MTKGSENRIECALVGMLNEVDKRYLRQLQEEMHRCAAKCCEDKESSVELVRACVEVCSENLKRARKVVQKEFNELQNRLQGCAVTCNNEVKHLLAKQPLDQQISLYSNTFDECVEKCIDSNIALIPFIMKKMKQILANNSPDKTESANASSVGLKKKMEI